MHASGPLVPSHAVSSQAPSSRARKLLVGGLSVLLAGCLFAPATDALAAPRPKPPSQQDVDKAQADARDKASQVKAIQAKLDAANAQLDKLNTAAETAAEDYNGAMLLVEQAQQESDAAQAKVAQAKQATAQMQDKMGAFAAASYRGQDKLAKLDALLNPDNAVNVMTRMSTLSTIARQQGDVLTDLRAAGVYIPSYSRAQWNVGVHVSRDQLQPGDLVFFASNTSNPSTIHHVGIYIGGGQMIEAPHTGTQVRVANAFRSGYIGAVRP
jgi:cell wall-associated NlpC family hydrolase